MRSNTDMADDDVGEEVKEPTGKQRLHDVSSSDKTKMPEMAYKGSTWRRYVNASDSIMGKGKKGKNHTRLPGYDSDMKFGNMIDELEGTLKITNTKLPRNSPYVMMFGCRRCFMRGTEDCSFGVKDGEQLTINGKIIGYCDPALIYHLSMAKIMSTPDGMRHIRNINTLNMLNDFHYYSAKLNSLRKADSLGKVELSLLDRKIKMMEKLGDRIDKAISQDEGLNINVRKALGPSDVIRMINMAREKDDEIE